MSQDRQLAVHRAAIMRADKMAKATGDQGVAVEARREYAAAKIASYVQRVISEAPPLSEDQKARLVILLCSPSGGDRAA
jgi:hypothetical protein